MTLLFKTFIRLSPFIIKHIRMASVAMETSPKKLKIGDEAPDKDVVESEAKEEEELPEGLDGLYFEDEAVGISRYMPGNEHVGFKCTMKKRYSDFLVNEIDENGQIVHLTDLTCPLVDEAEATETESLAHLSSILSEQEMERLKELTIKGHDKNDFLEINVDSLDKDARKLIHKSVSKAYPKLFTTTTSKDDLKFIKIGLTNNWKGSSWCAPGFDYATFTIYHEHRGTMDAIRCLSDATHVNNKSFWVSGTKDKKSIAVQRISAYRIRPKRLIQLNDFLGKSKHNPIIVGNISLEKNHLRLGQSKGNHFKIVFRDLNSGCGDEVVNIAFQNLQNNGFINYFGTQRFGIGTTLTHQIGSLLIRQQWKEAIEAILQPQRKDIKPRKDHLPSYNECLEEWKESKDSSTVYKLFQWKKSNEGQILKQLMNSRNDWRSSLLSLPRNNRSLYLHSYQSYVWNRLVSMRIAEQGTKVLEGDLLLPAVEDVDDESTEKVSVKPTVADAETAKTASIFDVVFPLVGSKVKLPENEYKEKLEQILKEDNITLATFDLLKAPLELRGSYRKIVAKPANMKWSIVNYEDETIRLFETDLDVLNGVKLEPENSGSKKGIKAEVSLGSSCYATIFARELTKGMLDMEWVTKEKREN